MGKRLIETTIWTQNKWFRKLKPEHKLLWIYLFCNCDSVGVWEEDLELASFIIGFEFNKADLNNVFGEKVKWINGKKLWLVDFCNFQYGTLKEENLTNKPHQSYISLLKKHSLWKDYVKTIQSHKEKDKDKEEDIDKEKDKEIDELFNSVVIFFDEDLRPKTESQIKNWKDVLDKLIRIDKKTPDQIKQIVKRARMDEFWNKNFMSLLKLRDKDKDGVQFFIRFEKQFNGKTFGIPDKERDYSNPQTF